MNWEKGTAQLRLTGAEFFGKEVEKINCPEKNEGIVKKNIGKSNYLEKN